MTLKDWDKVLRVRLWFRGRDQIVEFLVCWAQGAPLPVAGAVIEAMLDGLLTGVDGELIAWDDSCVEAMTVSILPSLGMQYPNG